MRKDVDCRTTISQIENILAGIGLTYSIIEREWSIVVQCLNIPNVFKQHFF